MSTELTCPHCGARMFATDEVCMTCGRERETQPLPPEDGDAVSGEEAAVLPAEFRYEPPLGSLLLKAVGRFLPIPGVIAITLAAYVVQSGTPLRKAHLLAALALVGFYFVLAAPALFWPVLRWWLLARRGWVRTDEDGVVLADHRGVATRLPWDSVGKLIAYDCDAKGYEGRVTSVDPRKATLEIGAWLGHRPTVIHAIVARAGMTEKQSDAENGITTYSLPPEALAKLVARVPPPVLHWGLQAPHWLAVCAVAAPGLWNILWCLYSLVSGTQMRVMIVEGGSDEGGIFARTPWSTAGKAVPALSFEWWLAFVIGLLPVASAVVWYLIFRQAATRPGAAVREGAQRSLTLVSGAAGRETGWPLRWWHCVLLLGVMVGLFVVLPLVALGETETLSKLAGLGAALFWLAIPGALIGVGIRSVVRAPRGQSSGAAGCVGWAMIVVGGLILAFLAFIALLLASGALP
jgi:hypothetical protein